MVETIDEVALNELPLAPVNPLPHRLQVRAIRAFHTGLETLRDAGGPVTRLRLGPKWLMPPVVVATSPQGARDILGRSGQHAERTRVHHEMRQLLGSEPFRPHPRALAAAPTRAAANLHQTPRPRLRRAHGPGRRYGRQQLGRRHPGRPRHRMPQADAAGARPLGARARPGQPLRRHRRTAAGHDEVRRRSGAAAATRPAMVADPGRADAHAPPATTLHQLADEILQACRADPTRDAPLVHALIAASDPATGRALSDDEIRDELVAFMFAGHDTTATTLTYALWALGTPPRYTGPVAAEVAAIGDRELTPETSPPWDTPFRCCTRRCGCARRPRRSAGLAMRDIEVDGYRVEAGTMLVVGIYALHRDPALWDTRWSSTPTDSARRTPMGRDRWQYLPFGAGPRSCIGDHFAMLEATLALATIIRRTEILSMDPDFPMIVPFTTVAAAPIRADLRLRM